MRVTIAHAAKTQGLMKKITFYEVSLSVQFSPQERAVINALDLGLVNVLDRDPPASLRGSENSSDWNLRIRGLIDRTDAYLCATPLEAKNYDSELRDALPKLKAYLDANATPMSGSDTFDL
jgi:hypothetical protein